ncbi:MULTISPECIES: NO-inducible flavohemoprotein [Rhizobium]|uniref:Flavohemoprotein n=1 Tax=Rhizobium favelukesii TaxID=348824 RepID=W6RKK4_9HYPH|nr:MULTISPECIES: NO-inducible flavohemoprotein [Rhizobium]MCS0459118.1 NO-inducible flavohemoprotein [Rhizobium favelukesii]UFS79686.1 NO-inducible flavohemoprotein [Rhizobium sp. T136]CDM61379.1 Flavohemoprotein [Rhizobium favelukesii]
MTQTLTETTKAIVRATVPALTTHGTEITAAMYKRLFENSKVRDLFNQSNQGEGGRQTKALAQAILAYAENIDNLAILTGAVERIAQKHVGLHIRPDHYPHVATALLGAIKDVLGEVATDDILNAWGEAFWFLANILIGREERIYDDLQSSEGGWNGWRQFAVASKRRESDIITSFVLRPVDGRAVVRHRPGQYLTFRFDIPGLPQQHRNYSISSAPNGESYRISVKREMHGLVSGFLHDQIEEGAVIEVAPPTGDFHLPPGQERPVVLLSGGVGLTPMVSMLETIANRGQRLAVHYVHGAENGSVHAMGPHVRDIAKNREHLKTTIFYGSPHDRDQKGVHFDHEGYITIDWLAKNTPMAEADFYLCGPRPFLAAFVKGLAKAGVTADRIHYEFFGPADELAAA